MAQTLGASGGARPAHTGVSDFRPPGLPDSKRLLLKPPSLWRRSRPPRDPGTLPHPADGRGATSSVLCHPAPGSWATAVG